MMPSSGGLEEQHLSQELDRLFVVALVAVSKSDALVKCLATLHICFSVKLVSCMFSLLHRRA
jgi:hypothetical protein